MVILDPKQASHPSPFLITNDSASEPSWACGLITVLPTEGSSKTGRTLVISGVTPTGTEAAMEFFTSAFALRDLHQRFQHEGYGGFSVRLPGRCQVPLQGYLPADVRVRSASCAGSLNGGNNSFARYATR